MYHESIRLHSVSGEANGTDTEVRADKLVCFNRNITEVLNQLCFRQWPIPDLYQKQYQFVCY